MDHFDPHLLAQARFKNKLSKGWRGRFKSAVASQRARPEPGKRIVALGLQEIAHSGVTQTGAGGKRGAAQRLVGAEAGF